jgi:hypothetical protein
MRQYQPAAVLLREGGRVAGHFVALTKEQDSHSWVMFDDKIDRSRPQPQPDLAAARYNGVPLQELVVAVGYLLVPDEGAAAIAAPVLSGTPPAESAASVVAQPPTATPTADSAPALAVSAQPSAASATAMATATATASASAPVQAEIDMDANAGVDGGSAEDVDTLPPAVNQPPRWVAAQGVAWANRFAAFESPETKPAAAKSAAAPAAAAERAEAEDENLQPNDKQAADRATSPALTDQRFGSLSHLKLAELQKLCEDFGLRVIGTKEELKWRIAANRSDKCSKYFAKRRTLTSYPGFGPKPAAPQPKGKRGWAKLGRGRGSLRPGDIRPRAQRQRQRKAQERRHSGSCDGSYRTDSEDGAKDGGGGGDEELDALLNGDERAESATVPALPSVGRVRPSGLCFFLCGRTYVRRKHMYVYTHACVLYSI